MTMHAMSTTFGCDACDEVLSLDLLCHATASERTLLCLRCCGCPGHGLGEDPGGTVVMDFRARQPWRGLEASPHRTRRPH